VSPRGDYFWHPCSIEYTLNSYVAVLICDGQVSPLLGFRSMQAKPGLPFYPYFVAEK
jgi:hypothetical protein